MQLIEEIKDQVPDSLSFQIGFLKAASKPRSHWQQKRLYDIHKTGGQINIWCEGVSNKGANK